MARHFLIDASALVPAFLPVKDPGLTLQVKRAVLKLLDLGGQKQANLYVPNFCMAECSKVFAKVAYRGTKDHDKATSVYRRYVGALLNVVSKANKGIIRSCELQRTHLIDIEEVFELEYQRFENEKHDFLSGLDALVIAMGRQLAKEHGFDQTLIVTADDRMARVCNYSDGRFPKAINVTKHPIPG